MLPSFSAEAVLTTMQSEGITVTNVASTMVTLLLSHPTVCDFDLTSLELVSCGGAPLSRATTIKAMQTFGCEFFLSYGMTECCGKISMSLLSDEVRSLTDEEQLSYICSSGKPFMMTEVRVVDALTGLDVERNGRDVGEVLIRGPTVFTGYWNNEKASNESFVDGWFKTGDVAFIEPRGYLTITDRMKDMILTGSENVYSVEVERVCHDHPAVKHACIYGVPNAAMGELVKAVVVLQPGQELKARELQKHCAKALADYKVKF